MKKIIFILLIFSVFGLSAETNLIVFPREPVDMSLSANPETIISNINSISFNSVQDYLESSKISLGENVPLLALSFLPNSLERHLPKSEILRITVVTGGLANLYDDKITDYLLHGEVFISSPSFDHKFNPYNHEEGNGLLLSAEYTGRGTNFHRESLLDDFIGAMDQSHIGINAYIVARADWTKQFYVLKIGYNKQLEDNTKGYFALSMSINIPISSRNNNLFYCSLYSKLADDFYGTSFQAGFVIPGEVLNRKLIPYVEFSDGETRLGMKVNL